MRNLSLYSGINDVEIGSWLAGFHHDLTGLKDALRHDRVQLPALFVIHIGKKWYSREGLRGDNTHCINQSFSLLLGLAFL
ncbi:MAG: hypothetical protein ACJ797_11440 [Ktedonobacteraceae bacterium]